MLQCYEFIFIKNNLQEFSIPQGSAYPYRISWGKKKNSGLSLYLMFVLYMETLYIFLEILVIISHLHLLFTCLYISYMVKTFCFWKTLDFDGSFFTGQPFV